MKIFRVTWKIWFVLVVSIIAITGCRTAETMTDSAEIQWRSLSEGRAEAAQTGNPLLIDFFFGEGCRRCYELEKSVYHDPEICAKVEKYFVPVRVDLTRELTADERAVEDQFRSGGECMLLFLDSAGNLLQTSKGTKLCFMGMVTKEQFSTYLDDVIATTHKL